MTHCNATQSTRLLSYNSRLLPIRNKGICGDEEIIDTTTTLELKLKQLKQLINESSRIVVFTGAGISTSCGIPDFRGPNGVWTREKRNNPIPKEEDTPEIFETATPSRTHQILKLMLDDHIISHVISQNVDGLHLRSGMNTNDLTELHGNIFLERCDTCSEEFFRDYDVGGMGCKPTGKRCDHPHCNGILYDCAVDWDTELPEEKFRRARHELDVADLVICLGTSLRIRPAGLLPLRTVRPKKKRGGRCGKLIIVNLQRTDLDEFASLKINYYCDEVMEALHTALQQNSTIQEKVAATSSTSYGNDEELYWKEESEEYMRSIHDTESLKDLPTGKKQKLSKNET